jgi:hypothetical protein
MMSNYVIAVYVNFRSSHVHGSHSVYLLKSGVTRLAILHTDLPSINLSHRTRIRLPLLHTDFPLFVLAP